MKIVLAGAFGKLGSDILRALCATDHQIVAADAVFLYCAAVVFKDPHRAQKYAKLAMVIALVSFILGVFRF